MIKRTVKDLQKRINETQRMIIEGANTTTDLQLAKRFFNYHSSLPDKDIQYIIGSALMPTRNPFTVFSKFIAEAVKRVNYVDAR